MPYSTPRKRNDLAIVVIVLVVVIVLPIVLSAVMYVMVMGFGSPEIPPTPTAVMAVDKGSDALTLNTIAVSSSYVSLNDVRLNLEAPQGLVAMNVGYARSPTSNISQESTASLSIVYDDMDADRLLSPGDTITITSMSGQLENGTYTLWLYYVPDNTAIAQIVISVP
jgi:FlaG/FlaF family flagellin (archaellin)